MNYNKILMYSSGAAFTYGFLRGMNASYEAPHDVIGTKACLAFMNGITYAIPPYTPFYIVKLINRIDIKMTGKDPSKHMNDYEDMFCKNYNVVF